MMGRPMSFSPSRSESIRLRSTWGSLTLIAVSPEKIEGVVDELILFARGEFGLEFGEIGAALMDDDHFPVEDRLAGDVQRAGDHGETLSPVQPVAGEHALLPLVEVDLNTVAVELDFVQPLVAGRRL